MFLKRKGSLRKKRQEDVLKQNNLFTSLPLEAQTTRFTFPYAISLNFDHDLTAPLDSGANIKENKFLDDRQVMIAKISLTVILTV